MLAKDLADHFGTPDGREFYRFQGRVPYGLSGTCIDLGIMGDSRLQTRGQRYLLSVEINRGDCFKTLQFVLKDQDWITFKEYQSGMVDTSMITSKQMGRFARTLVNSPMRSYKEEYDTQVSQETNTD